MPGHMPINIAFGNSGRIGSVERAISREADPGCVYTTGQLTRAVYHDRFYRNLNGPPIELKSYHYLQIRKSAPTFLDCIGRDNTRPGRPYLWKARDEDFYTVRNRKTKRDAEGRNRDRIRRQSANKTKAQP